MYGMMCSIGFTINGLIRTQFFLFMAVAVTGWCTASHGAELQKFTDVRLIDSPANDGDSFLVEAGGRRLRVRLYFVDCPETSVSSRSDARRVREQTRYFGLREAARTIHFGNEARAFVRSPLANPFPLPTALATALGSSSVNRVYGFVTTAGGNDLASLLVEKGLARSYGVGRRTPDGVSRDEMTARLRDLEISAMLKGIGIWSESDPALIAESRAKQRAEERELRDMQKEVRKTGPSKGLIDLNRAGKRELMSIDGIGPVLVERIISGRPYGRVDDLRKVKGIGPKKLEKIRSYVTVGAE